MKSFLLKILFIVCTACSVNAPPVAPKKPLVLVTIAPYQFLAEKIAGNTLEILPVVPPNTSPHAFEPTSRQISEISRGQILFLIGEPFEEKILPILKKQNPSLIAYDLRQGIQLLEDADYKLSCQRCSMEHLDRHVWLSPKLAIDQAKAMEKILSSRFPENKALFQENLNLLCQELLQLDTEISLLLKPVKDRVLLVSHPAFGYFCRDYNFQQLSVEYEGKDPRPKHLEKVLQQASFHQAEFALALPQYNNKGAQLIAERLHLPVRWIDPYSANYFETLRTLAHLIADPQYQP